MNAPRGSQGPYVLAFEKVTEYGHIKPDGSLHPHSSDQPCNMLCDILGALKRTPSPAKSVPGSRFQEAWRLLEKCQQRIHSDVCGHSCCPDCLELQHFLAS